MSGQSMVEKFVEKKGIHLSSPHPMSIHWLEEINKEKLLEGILSAEYVQVLGNKYPIVTKNERINIRIFKFRVNDIKINTIIEYAREKQYGVEEALYAYFLEESIKIRKKKTNMGDVEGYAIKYIGSKDEGFSNRKTFIEYLEEIKKLDISNFKNIRTLFLSGYDGGSDIFSNKNYDGVTMLCSEQEIMINQIIRDVERKPELYKDMLERLQDIHKN